MKRNSYTVLLANDEIFEIESFLIVNVNNDTKCFALGKYLLKQKNTLFPGIKLEHLYFVKYYGQLAAIEAKNINEKVRIIKIENDPILVVCKHPNKYEMLT